MDSTVLTGLSLPFIGTTLGSAMVFFIRDKVNPKIEKVLLGFAAGVMIAASVWSLLLPAIDMSISAGGIAWVPAAVGFLVGAMFLLLLDHLIPHLHLNSNEPEGPHTKLKKNTMLMLAVTLHNIPEGMAVGVVFAGLIAKNNLISASGALALALGIAIQNFPEGAIISMPLKAGGEPKLKAFWKGTLSGAVEPIASVLTILITGLITSILPYTLAFAAGAMIYVVVEELIPESQSDEHSDLGTIGAVVGFTLMMVLDVALG
ncbi:MAG: ZIP zinc transporter [Treponema sp. CETP13]|nr:MAG: ZIP zinc transporter [Treponema sp. CETP13]